MADGLFFVMDYFYGWVMGSEMLKECLCYLVSPYSENCL